MTTLAEHAECGLHSGLPLCCVTWYLTAWRLLWRIDFHVAPVETIGEVDFLMDGVTVRYQMLAPWGYVPCPSCIVRNNRVNMRSCACDVDARMESR